MNNPKEAPIIKQLEEDGRIQWEELRWDGLRFLVPSFDQETESFLLQHRDLFGGLFVLACLPLAKKLVSKKAVPQEHKADLIMDVLCRIFDQVSWFDETKVEGHRFFALATHQAVRKAMWHYFLDGRRSVSASSIEAKAHDDGQEFTIEAPSPFDLHLTYQSAETDDAFSLFAHCLARILEDEDDDDDREMWIAGAILHEDHHGNGWGASLAKAIGVSRQAINQAKKKTIQKMRSLIDFMGLQEPLGVSEHFSDGDTYMHKHIEAPSTGKFSYISVPMPVEVWEWLSRPSRRSEKDYSVGNVDAAIVTERASSAVQNAADNFTTRTYPVLSKELSAQDVQWTDPIRVWLEADSAQAIHIWVRGLQKKYPNIDAQKLLTAVLVWAHAQGDGADQPLFELELC